jgi:hypothetical protein
MKLMSRSSTFYPGQSFGDRRGSVSEIDEQPVENPLTGYSLYARFGLIIWSRPGRSLR